MKTWKFSSKLLKFCSGLFLGNICHPQISTFQALLLSCCSSILSTLFFWCILGDDLWKSILLHWFYFLHYQLWSLLLSVCIKKIHSFASFKLVTAPPIIWIYSFSTNGFVFIKFQGKEFLFILPNIDTSNEAFSLILH